GGGPLVSAGGMASPDGESESPLQWGGDIFVTKLDGAGNLVWNRRFGDSDMQAPNAIAVSAAGDSALTGLLQGNADFGDGPRGSAMGGVEMFAVKLDAAANLLWSGVYRGIGDSVALDGEGYTILTGEFSDTLDFGLGVSTRRVGGNIFLARLHEP